MAPVTWEEMLSVNDVHLDAQHKHIFSIMNKLDDEICDESRAQVLGPAIDSLVHFAEAHLQEEEALLERANYPSLEMHRRMHRFFLKEIDTLKFDFRAGRIMHAKCIVHFLRDWFSYHVFNEDRKYDVFIHQLCPRTA
jgi:hemerythrin-like metal-binding protein